MDTIKQQPKVVELRPGIFQFRSERPGSHVYLIKGHTKNLLVDTGTASNYANLSECLSVVGLGPHHIHTIILTHEHFDHIGAVPYFFDTAVVAAHGLAANKIELQDEFVMMSKYLDHSRKTFHVDIWLQADTVLDLGNYRIRVLHTPGHCSGCLCLYEMHERLLFTGDTVLAGGILSGILGSGNISDYISSLVRLNTLRVKELYPGHGRISLNPHDDLEKALQAAQSLLEDTKILFETLDTESTYEQYFADLRKFPTPPRC